MQRRMFAMGDATDIRRWREGATLDAFGADLLLMVTDHVARRQSLRLRFAASTPENAHSD